eukprot:scaffold159355_cov16-Prasinocladus_malaysianus.AAC.1
MPVMPSGRMTSNMPSPVGPHHDSHTSADTELMVDGVRRCSGPTVAKYDNHTWARHGTFRPYHAGKVDACLQWNYWNWIEASLEKSAADCLASPRGVTKGRRRSRKPYGVMRGVHPQPIASTMRGMTEDAADLAASQLAAHSR